jgi:SH3-like domain-containing protein
MKNINRIIIVISIFCLVGLGLPEYKAKAATINQYYALEGINPRAENNWDSAVMMKVPRGYAVQVNMDNYKGTWYEVTFKGSTGWIPLKYLSSTRYFTDYVTNSEINIRKESLWDSEVVIKIPKHTTVWVVNNGTSLWPEIIYQGKTGYIPMKYITEKSKIRGISNLEVYSSFLEEGSGSIDLEWTGESGSKYEVDLFNGRDYVTVAENANLEWSSRGENLYPTVNQFANGQTSYVSGDGEELAKNPSELYRLNNIDYSGDNKYYLRLTEYNNSGEIIATSKIDNIEIPGNDESEYFASQDEIVAIDKILRKTDEFQLENDETDVNAANFMLDSISKDPLLSATLDQGISENSMKVRGAIGWGLKAIKAFGYVARLGGSALSRALKGVSPKSAYVIRKYSRKINKATEKLNSATKQALVKALRAAGIPKKEAEIIADAIFWII